MSLIFIGVAQANMVKCTINTGIGADIFTPDHSPCAAAEVVHADAFASVSVYHFKEAIFCHLG